MRVWLLAALMCACAAVPAAAQQDVEGSKDHPMVSRFPGYYIEEYDAQDFSNFEFDNGGDGIKVEGRYWRIEYWLQDGRKKGGPVEIARNYLNTFTSRGGSKVYDDVDASGGTLVAKLPADGKNIWLEVQISDAGEVYELTIVEEAAMTQQVEFTAMELAKALNETGSVALHNIQFDTGKATITSASSSALAPVGELLKSDTSLTLEIQGHTDNVGAAAANLKLSQDRAAAVKAYLVQNFGIAADRLTTAGFGDTKPIADNTSDAGRAQNRRVELVKK
jgi:outer membrane protein OmpA-like peptidoglycan-associated protein